MVPWSLWWSCESGANPSCQPEGEREEEQQVHHFLKDLFHFKMFFISFLDYSVSVRNCAEATLIRC